MNNDVINILASNLANQAISIAKLKAENNELKKLLAKANDQLNSAKKEMRNNEPAKSNFTNGQK